jgi:rhamnosyltransferase
MNIYEVVPWFNPVPEYAKKIRTYLDRVAGVVIVDDSTSDHYQLVSDIPGANYYCARENRGIAHALNVGYAHAARLGADWILTMDQDSAFDDHQLAKLLDATEQLASDPGIAVIGPNFHGSGIPNSVSATWGLKDCDGVISSGSMVRLSAFHTVGGYNEDMFIDQVDHEFCYRLRRRGFRVLRLEGIFVDHIVGVPSKIKIFGLNILSSNHGAARKYYMTRNSLFMRRHYRDFGAPYLEMIFLMFLGTLILEDQKLTKTAHIIKGAWHHLRGIKGKMP